LLRLPPAPGDHGHGTTKVPALVYHRRLVAGVFAVLDQEAGSRVPETGRRQTDWEAGMLWTIFVILLVLWLLGMVSSYTLGGFIHILLVIALAILLIRVIQGRRVV